jgi:PPOX class probable F420-dependent enzyme
LQVLADSRYVQLTTFRRDGRAVVTPVWAVRRGDELLVWTNPDAGKVKRVRATKRVRLVPCTVRGRARGLPVDGTARVLPPQEAPAVLDAIARKYGVQGWISKLSVRWSRSPAAAIAISLVPTGSGMSAPL